MICPECNGTFSSLKISIDGYGPSDRTFEDCNIIATEHDDHLRFSYDTTEFSAYYAYFNMPQIYGDIYADLEKGIEVACPLCDKEIKLKGDCTTEKLVWLPVTTTGPDIMEVLKNTPRVPFGELPDWAKDQHGAMRTIYEGKGITASDLITKLKKNTHRIQAPEELSEAIDKVMEDLKNMETDDIAGEEDNES